MTNWLGGMGIVVLFVAVLPALGVKGTALYGAESVGPTKDKLRPKIKETAIILWGLYTGISALQVILLMLGGLDWFNATTVMFGTMGAAGYAPHDASIAFYESAYVEWVCIIFMFIAGSNFALYYRILQKKFSKVFHDGEYRLYWKIVLFSTLFVSLSLFSKGLFNLSDSVRHAAFQVVSFITTTGFSSTNYTNWPIFAQTVLYVLCYVGGCAGSTGGGIKVVRIGVMMKLFKNSMIKRFHPNAVTTVRLGEDRYSNDTIQAIAGFVGFYITNAIIGTLVLSLTEVDFLVVHTSVLLTLGNIGIGLGGIGTDFTFAIYPQWAEVIGQTVKQGFKFLCNDILFKVIQPDGLIIQEQYIPGEGTESLYAVINETNAGTQEDPIPYNGNMALENGKYYSQDGVIYLCNRDTKIPVYQALKDLVGLYVEVAE